MKRWMQLTLAGGGTLALLVCAFFVAPLVSASVNDFTITRFETDYTLTNKDPQGELRIVEDISVDFRDRNHGILRAIPTTYKGHRLLLHINKVSSKSGAPASYTTYNSGGNLVLKIGDPSSTVTGSQSYTVDYTAHNVISFYNDHDELYWDINGDQWAQPTWYVATTVHIPAELTFANTPPRCFAGSYGDTSNRCLVAYAGTVPKFSAHTTVGLQPYQTLTVVAGFKPGYFKPSSALETAGEYRSEVLSFAVPFVLLAGSTGLLWYLRGRDAKGKGTIVPQYDAPHGLKPLDVGALIDFKTDNRDITAAIIDLAVQGYLVIVEEKQERKLRRDITLYYLRLRKTDFSALDARQKELITNLFSTLTVGEVISLKDKANKLSKVALNIRKDTRNILVTSGYIRARFSSLMGAGIAGFLSFLFVFGYIFLDLARGHGFILVGFLAGAIVACAFLVALPSRTEKGVLAKEHIEGLKLYLKTAEADRLKMLQSPSSPYAPKGPEPKQTIHLFEKLLPYAIVLGVEAEWAKKFENLYHAAPDWYQGDVHTFNTIYLASVLSGGMQASVNTAFSSPRSSSGSGFGGGGFSGGGGGGGGGGGW